MTKAFLEILILSLFVWQVFPAASKVELDRVYDLSPRETSLSYEFRVNETTKGLMKKFLIFTVNSDTVPAPTFSLYINQNTVTYTSPKSYAFAVKQKDITINRTIFITVEHEENQTGSFSLSFSDERVVVIGRNFIDEIDQGPHHYKLKLPEGVSADKYESALIYTFQTEVQPLTGEFVVVGKDFKKPMLTFENTGYFMRLYSDKETPLKELVESSYISMSVTEPNSITIVSSLRGQEVFLDEEVYGAAGDYITKGRTNCYSTSKLFAVGGLVYVQLSTPDVNVYIHPGNLPSHPKDFLCKYSRADYTVLPASPTFSTINFPVPQSIIGQAPLVHVCIEGTGKDLVYALDIGQHAPAALDNNQWQKIYVAGNESQMLFYPRISMQHSSTLLHIRVIDGCANVLIKPRRTYYYGYLFYGNISQGLSPFADSSSEETWGQVAWKNLKPEQGEIVKVVPQPEGDTLCSGHEIYADCPTFLAVESCNSSLAIVSLMISKERDVEMIQHAGVQIAASPGEKRFLVLPNVSPAADNVQIIVQNRKTETPTKLGRIHVTRRGIVSNTSLSEQLIEINSRSNKTIVEFTKDKSGPLEGSYYITIESDSYLNAGISSKIVFNSNGNTTEVFDARQSLGGDFFTLQPVNKTYQIGYYTYYLKDSDTVLIPKPTGSLSEMRLLAGTTAWPKEGSAQWSGKQIRLHLSDTRALKNAYYYIVAEGTPVADATSDGNLAGLFNFLILEAKRYDRLTVGKTHRFGATRMFRFVADKEGDYIIKKRGTTLEDMYVSIDPENPVPYEDRNNYQVKEQDDGGKDELPELTERKIEIKGDELKKINKDCFSDQKENEKCAVYITVACHWPRCMYDLEIQYAPTQPRKVDLQL